MGDLLANIPITLDWVNIIITLFTTIISVVGAFIFFNTRLIGSMHKNLILRISNLEKSDAQKTTEINRLHNELICERNENQKLYTKIQLIESAHFDMPLPMWLKDTNGLVLYANPKYEEVFLAPRGYSLNDYIGKDDSNVWPLVIADAFKAHDKYVIDTGKEWDGYELVHHLSKNKWWRIIKYPRYAGNIKIGIAGIAIPYLPLPDGVKENNNELG